jgi:hypothetical protein
MHDPQAARIAADARSAAGGFQLGFFADQRFATGSFDCASCSSRTDQIPEMTGFLYFISFTGLVVSVLSRTFGSGGL